MKWRIKEKGECSEGYSDSEKWWKGEEGGSMTTTTTQRKVTELTLGAHPGETVVVSSM